MMDTQSVTIDTILEDVKKAGGKSPEELGKAEDALMTQRKDATDQATQAITRGQLERTGLMGKEIKPAPQPKLQNIPAAPGGQKFRDPTEGAGGAAMFLAGIASLFTRRPLQTALDSASASMEAFHKGDTKRMENERQKWKDAVEVALKQNTKELEQYKAAMEGLHMTQTERMAKMQATAAGVSDEVMKTTLATGNIDLALKILEGRQKAAEGLAEKVEVANLRAQIYAHGRPSASDERKRSEALSAKEMIDQVMSGEAIQFGGTIITKQDIDEFAATKIKPATGYNPKQEAIIRLFKMAEHAPDKTAGGTNAPKTTAAPAGVKEAKDGTRFKKDGWVWEKRGNEMIPLYPEGQAPAPGANELGAQSP